MLNSEADPEMETALVDTLGALVHLERFGTIHHCVTPRYNSKAFWERLPAMPSLKVIAAYMYNVCSFCFSKQEKTASAAVFK